MVRITAQLTGGPAMYNNRCSSLSYLTTIAGRVVTAELLLGQERSRNYLLKFVGPDIWPRPLVVRP